MTNSRNFAFRCGALLGLAALTLGAARAQQPVDFPANAAGQVVFVMPSHNVECTYTPQGGTAVYQPFDGGPELSCDRQSPKYIRIVLTPKSLRRFDDVGDQGCCGTDNPFRYGGHWARGPFACDSLETGLSCKRSDGHGFVLSRERVDTF
jgi:hypothetical protein